MKSTVIFDYAIKENAIRLAENTKVKLSKMKSTVLFWTAVEENSIGLAENINALCFFFFCICIKRKGQETKKTKYSLILKTGDIHFKGQFLYN